jgi:hypothetical protein
MSDLSISTPSPSNHSIMWGYVTYIFLCIWHNKNLSEEQKITLLHLII